LTGSAAEVAAAILARHSFVLTSHARPDGDAIGSQLALAFALEALGKTVRLVDHDPAPGPYRVFPGTGRIEVTNQYTGDADAVIVLECGDLSRTEVAGFDRAFVINIDHHLGNTIYGAVNWFDESAAACAELVADLIDALGVPWTRDIAAHLYLGIATDTGGFRHANITVRTFEACRRIAATGVEPAALSRQIFDSYSLGRVRLMGLILSGMDVFHAGRVATLYFDDQILASCGATLDDTNELVNLPLGARDVVAVALFKLQSPGTLRVSLRSKGDVDVRAVAQIWGGGGHKNASGCTIMGDLVESRRLVIEALGRALSEVRS